MFIKITLGRDGFTKTYIKSVKMDELCLLFIQY